MKKVLVRGPILSRSGYGEHARFLLRSLRAYESHLDIYAITTGWGKTGWIWEDDDERTWIDGLLTKTVVKQQEEGNLEVDISIQVTIPNEWEKLAPVNIGVTAGIETTKIAPVWVERANMMDKIIVVSEHAKYGFETTSYQAQDKNTGQVIPEYRCVTPIEVVHYPVRKFEPTDLNLKFDYDFNFLVVAQWSVRKNVENTITWFMKEFRDDEVGLVLKINTVNNSTIDRHVTEERVENLLRGFKNRKCKVHLIHGCMTDSEMTALYTHPQIKALVSLTHGEGFGLPLFEAAYNGLPVVAPNWSGHVDFLHAPVRRKKKTTMKPLFAKVDYSLQAIQPEAYWDGVLQPDSMWCFPQENSYKSKIREVYKAYPRYLSMAKKLKTYINKSFKEKDQFACFVEAVLGYIPKNVDAAELPKISIITSVYDGDQFIEPFLEDITRQSIFKDKCELILINANSPGNETPVIKKYMDKFPDNIVYKQLKADPGIYGTWNVGVGLATGEYITNANLDDRKAPNSLEKHATELYLNKNVDLVYADSFVTHEPNESFEENSSNGNRYQFEPFSKEAMLRGNQPHNNPMWRAELHKKYGDFDESLKSAGDWEFFLRCSFGGSQFKKLEEILGLYYFNPTGISTNPEHESWKMKEELQIYKTYQEKYMEEMANAK